MLFSTPCLPAPLTRLLPVAGLGLALLLLAPNRAHAQTWLVSTDAYVKLGVVDKFGTLGAYSAHFVVTSRTSGKVYVLVKEVAAGQNGVDVVFPSEPSEADYFKTDKNEAATSKPGNYTWECQVNGKRAVGGHFEIPPAGNDVTVIEKPR